MLSERPTTLREEDDYRPDSLLPTAEVAALYDVSVVTARNIMNEAGAFFVGNGLKVRYGNLMTWEKNRQRERQALVARKSEQTDAPRRRQPSQRLDGAPDPDWFG